MTLPRTILVPVDFSPNSETALDYAVDSIRVNSVLVGSVATRLTLDGLDEAGGPEAIGLTFAENAVARIAEPREIAATIGFLL